MPPGGTLRCIPYFHILGVSKCGTTDLYHRLSKHPQMFEGLNKVSQRGGEWGGGAGGGRSRGSGPPPHAVRLLVLESLNKAEACVRGGGVCVCVCE